MPYQIKSFNNEKYGSVRLLLSEDCVYINLYDVCINLGFAQKFKEMLLLKKNEVEILCSKLAIKGLSLTDQSIPIKKDTGFDTTYISKDAFIDLALESENSDVKEFIRWITKCIIPCIKENEDNKNFQITDEKEKQLRLKVSQLKKLIKVDQRNNLLVLDYNQAMFELVMYLQNKEMKKIHDEITSLSEKKCQSEEKNNTIVLKKDAEWRKQTNTLIAKACLKTRDYEGVKNIIYNTLEKRTGYNLYSKLADLKEKNRVKGMSDYNVSKLNNLDVIEDDERLKKTYISIVKEVAVKSGVKVDKFEDVAS